MMMNGELMEQAVGGKPGSFLADLLERRQATARARRASTWSTTSTSPRSSRYPTRRESRGRPASSSNRFPDTIDVLEDLFWALLNSNEFVLNR